MKFNYFFNFGFKDLAIRNTVDLRRYSAMILPAVDTYNRKSSSSKNPKHIDVYVHRGYIEIHLASKNALNPKYVGIAAKLLSQILVDSYGFDNFCIGNPGKLFVTV